MGREPCVWHRRAAPAKLEATLNGNVKTSAPVTGCRNIAPCQLHHFRNWPALGRITDPASRTLTSGSGGNGTRRSGQNSL